MPSAASLVCRGPLLSLAESDNNHGYDKAMTMLTGCVITAQSLLEFIQFTVMF